MQIGHWERFPPRKPRFLHAEHTKCPFSQVAPPEMDFFFPQASHTLSAITVSFTNRCYSNSLTSLHGRFRVDHRYRRLRRGIVYTILARPTSWSRQALLAFAASVLRRPTFRGHPAPSSPLGSLLRPRCRRYRGPEGSADGSTFRDSVGLVGEGQLSWSALEEVGQCFPA